MRAVAHSKKFAKKVGVPQSVGREFVAHDKRVGKYAGGGRVKRLRDWIETAKGRKTPRSHASSSYDYGYFGENNPQYQKMLKNWDPEITDEEWTDLTRYALGDMANGSVDPEVLDRIVKDRGILLSDVADSNNPLKRAISLSAKKKRMYDDMQPHSTIAHQSTTIDDETLLDFVDANMGLGDDIFKLLIEPKSDVKVLPIPISGQNEFVLPRGVELAPIDKFEDLDGIMNYVMQTRGKKKYEGGGRVKKFKKMLEMYPLAYGREGTERDIKRLERLLDENPGIEKVVDPYTLVKSSGSSGILANLDAKDYIDIAGMDWKDYGDIFKREAKDLGKRINSTKKMHTIPMLEVRQWEPGPLYSDVHDGRHRAQLLGDRGLKVPTSLHPFSKSIKDADLETVLKWLDEQVVRTNTGKEGSRLIPLKGKTFADGGQVDESSSIEDLLRLTDQMAASAPLGPPAFSIDPSPGGEEALMHAIVKAFSRNWAGRDKKTGKLEMGKTPGIVNYTKGLPALAMDLSDLVLPRAPWAGKERPEWSTRALEEAGLQEERVDELTPLTPGNAFVDSLSDMLMQVPIPGRSVATGVSKVPKAVRAVTAPVRSVAEYIGPTVEPKVSSYATGTAGGGLLDLLGREDSALEELLREVGPLEDDSPAGELEGRIKNFDSRQYFADGGKVRRTARAMKAVKDALSHVENNDVASALRALSSTDIGNDPGIEEVRRMLRGPSAGQAKKNLSKAVEDDSNVNKVPLL